MYNFINLWPRHTLFTLDYYCIDYINFLWRQCCFCFIWKKKHKLTTVCKLFLYFLCSLFLHCENVWSFLLVLDLKDTLNYIMQKLQKCPRSFYKLHFICSIKRTSILNKEEMIKYIFKLCHNIFPMYNSKTISQTRKIKPTRTPIVLSI